MADLNEVRLIGRLTKDPAKRALPGGSSVTEFGLATNRKFAGQDGQKREEVLFVDVVCFGKLADVAAQWLAKGRQAFVAGRLRLDSWEDRNSGQRRSKVSVVAENIQFLDGGKDRRDAQEQGGFDREAESLIPDYAVPEEPMSKYVPPESGTGRTRDTRAGTGSATRDRTAEDARWKQPTYDEPPF